MTDGTLHDRLIETADYLDGDGRRSTYYARKLLREAAAHLEAVAAVAEEMQVAANECGQGDCGELISWIQRLTGPTERGATEARDE